MVSPAITAVMLNTRSDSFGAGLGYGGSGAWFAAGRSTQSPGLDSVANDATINVANFVAETLASAATTQGPRLPFHLRDRRDR